jgi:hypothetical protein
MASLISSNVEKCLKNEEATAFFLKGVLSYNQLLFYTATLLIRFANELSERDLIKFLSLYKEHSIVLLPSIHGCFFKLMEARKLDEAELIIDFMILYNLPDFTPVKLTLPFFGLPNLLLIRCY